MAEPILGISPEAIDFKFEDLSEAKNEVDGTHILGKVSGTFFVPNGVSRNQRFYSLGLWEGVLNNTGVKQRLEERRMLGTISHEQRLDDMALLEGKMSHIVVGLEIKEGNQGYGEALILDTPAGRILNTLLRAGVKLFVSSRATGSFSGQEAGVPKVNPKDYVLETFDFVIDPGFLQASPELSESFKNEIKTLVEELRNLNLEGGNTVPDTNPLTPMLEKANKDNGKLQTDLDSALSEIETLKSDHLVTSDENTHLKEENDKFKEDSETLKKYKEFGNLDKLGEAFDIAESNSKFLADNGGTEKIGESLKSYAEMKEKIEDISDDGNIDEIKTALTLAKSKLEKYQKFGSLDKLGEMFTVLEADKKNREDDIINTQAVKLSKELKAPETKIGMLLKRGVPESEIRDLFTMGEARSFSNQFKKTGVTDLNESGNAPIIENQPVTPAFKDSTLSKLANSFK